MLARAALVVLVSAVVAVLAACGSHDAPSSPPSATGRPPRAMLAHGAGSPAPTPAPTLDACDAMNRAYDDALAHADGGCATDGDCACYPGGLGAQPTCGGVTDRKTAAALQAIADTFAQQACRMSLQCAPSRCAPRCDHGRCR